MYLGPVRETVDLVASPPPPPLFLPVPFSGLSFGLINAARPPSDRGGGAKTESPASFLQIISEMRYKQIMQLCPGPYLSYFKTSLSFAACRDTPLVMSVKQTTSVGRVSCSRLLASLWHQGRVHRVHATLPTHSWFSLATLS